MKPYFESMADDDAVVGWQKVLLAVQALVATALTVVLVGAMRRPPIHIDAGEVPRLPVERLENSTPDLMNAMGMASDAAVHMLRLHRELVAEDQAWLLNRMIPELADAYDKKVADVIEVARKARGEIKVTVKSVTPVQSKLPYQIEVVVQQEFLGDFQPPGKGKPDPTNARREEFRYTFTLVRTQKTTSNRDALLIRDIAMATAKS